MTAASPLKPRTAARRSASPRRLPPAEAAVAGPGGPVDLTVHADGTCWHLQHWPGPCNRQPALPPTVLLHGTGASVHSWRHLAPRLAVHGDVLAVDLPGHGGTGPLPQGEVTLPAVAAALWSLLDGLAEGVRAARWRLVGHSAGAAVAVQMALQRPQAVTAVHGINAALLPFRGVMGEIAPRMARFLARQPLVPHLVAFGALDPSVVPLLLAGTGSRLDAEGQAQYRRLATQPRHVAGTLALMAGWDLEALQRSLPRLKVPLHLLAAERDRTVAPALADDIVARVPGATATRLPGAGHLAHEEAAPAVARWLDATPT